MWPGSWSYIMHRNVTLHKFLFYLLAFRLHQDMIWATSPQSSYFNYSCFSSHQTSSSLSDLNPPQLTLFTSCMTEVSIIWGSVLTKGWSILMTLQEKFSLKGVHGGEGIQINFQRETSEHRVLWWKKPCSIKASRTTLKTGSKNLFSRSYRR